MTLALALRFNPEGDPIPRDCQNLQETSANELAKPVLGMLPQAYLLEAGDGAFA